MRAVRNLFDSIIGQSKTIPRMWLVFCLFFIITGATIADHFYYDRAALYYSIWVVAINSVLMFIVLKTSTKLAATLLVSCLIIVFSLIAYYLLLEQALIV